MTTKTQDQRIVEWNEERKLIKPLEELNMVNEMSFILEEVIEGLTETESVSARELAVKLADIIAGGYLETAIDILDSSIAVEKQTVPITEESLENFVDALGDIKVFATGSIRKSGYNPDKAMDEILEEIESRKGSIQNGKFIKDKSPEAQANWYKANFNNAKI